MHEQRAAGPAASYTDLDGDGQVEVLRPVARQAAATFGLEVRELTLVLHAYNTTFRLDTADGRRLALRVNTNSHSSTANIAAQQAWLHALATETDVRVPDPVRALDGGWDVAVDCPTWGGPLHVDGGDLARGRRRGGVRRGAGLRARARRWPRCTTTPRRSGSPTAATLPLFDEPLFGDENLLLEVLPVARAGCRGAHRGARASAGGDSRSSTPGSRPVVLHADLHGGNLKWHDGRLAVFDLDDAGIGSAGPRPRDLDVLPAHR